MTFKLSLMLQIAVLPFVLSLVFRNDKTVHNYVLLFKTRNEVLKALAFLLYLASSCMQDVTYSVMYDFCCKS
jgi:hypothetical protein